LRFAYHLYQGPLASISILPLGFVFAAMFWRWRNIWPLVVAHTIANVVSLLVTPR
jgi:membrane protease YdiL (CAAX protease family)